MERDAILAHGALQFLKETMFERSDAYSFPISNKSGLLSIVNQNENKHICMSSDGPVKFDDSYDMNILTKNSEDADIYKVNVPYNTNLLIQECMAMGISMRLIPKETPEYSELTQLEGDDKFELQDQDLRKIYLEKSEKKKKVKFLQKNKKNKEKYIDKTFGNKIHIKNLSTNTTSDDLKELFSTVGTIFDIKMDNSLLYNFSNNCL